MFTFVNFTIQVHGTIRRAAEALGVPSSTFWEWLKKKFTTRPVRGAPARSE